MRIDPTHEPSSQTLLAVPTPDCAENVQVIGIEPEQSIEGVLTTLRQCTGPVILQIPEEQSQAFSEAAHFEWLRQQITVPISFVMPDKRRETLGSYAHQHGFPVASSVEQAIPSTVEEMVPQEQSMVQAEPLISLDEHSQEALPVPKRSRLRLIGIMVALLVTSGIILLPALSSSARLMSTTSSVASGTTVGQVTFSSSGQLDAISSTGLNDVVMLSLSQIGTPAPDKSYDAWLMANASDDQTVPLLLGKLTVASGKTQLTYTDPGHKNLLATYSRLLIAEQDGNPTTPPLDQAAWRYVGSIPNTPTPGDEHRYSLLDHMRHLLASDPTLQEIGLQGGLVIWLDRNAEKILEWSSAARDNWTGGQQTALIHRHMLRVLEYLDGAYVFNTGDVPPGSPLLVDPQAGRLGLLEVSPTQVIPSLLTHVHLHLQGMIMAPGHTIAQSELAVKIDHALQTDTLLLQHVRQDAIKLAQMSDEQLKSNEALLLLNDMEVTANTAYTGQFDPITGGNVNGIAWIKGAMQGLADIPVTTA